MTEPDTSRRALLAGGLLVAGCVTASDANAQANIVIDNPAVVRELAAQFTAYDKALGDNDVAALNGFFFDSPTTIRYGTGENLYGYAEIKSYRAGVSAPGTPPKRERTVITTYGNDFGTVSTLSSPNKAGRTIRTMQTWVRFPQGWRIVAAHVSFMGA